MSSSGKFKQFFTIPEAALFWSGLPFSLLSKALFIDPGIPYLLEHPLVAERAEALVEATDFELLVVICGHMDPDMPLPPPEQRLIARADLIKWLREYWPAEMPTTAIQTTRTNPAHGQNKSLLREKEVLALLGISRATLNRKRAAGEFPAPTHTNPNRWPFDLVGAYVDQSAVGR